MSPTIVLITGANRGLGKGLLELYLAKPNHIVIAANRDPTHETSQALTKLPTATGTSLRVVKIDALSPSDAANAVTSLIAEGIDHIDILIANAAVGFSFPKVSDVLVEEIQRHIDTNVYGLIRLYQAFLPLLRASQNPKWVTMGSGAGNFIPMRNAAYAPTKTMQHWYTKAISVEEPWLTAFPVDPGWVQTDLGNRGAEEFGLEKAAITIDESVQGLLKLIDTSTLKTHSGKMWLYDGREEPW
ncbi:hypothetical protein AOCH_002931 [Aspergillus ochraceoroseus]|uniref:Aflatoxin biosynthesis ketoreductase nor-1 n=1 Tax=Aspergillus ochraceoroseus TaxID=138278 RepID=A0A0F8XBZ4_9EURO|nr:hypothetical protein AOCH_002931 [Aspergillus ochraceoroseus]